VRQFVCWRLVLAGADLAAPLSASAFLPEYAHQVHDAERQSRELEAKTARMLSRLDRKVQALHDLLDGRCTLLQTVRAFQQIDQELGFRDPGRNVPEYQCTTDECYARAVLGWADAELQHRPRGEQTLPRLKADLENLIRSGALRP
jgi:hypothetical protein